jgi:hypothetical protein
VPEPLDATIRKSQVAPGEGPMTAIDALTGFVPEPAFRAAVFVP